ncbi:dihydrofolate reductase family protein [Microbacterium invictum]|uniref:Dihydrofolate reductase family protein n=1 Tax=Microbacterium invictum TaxID=515415 RepID=A0ABZ0VAY6_9MICO|nr:dihydrofolate reductase family protein [Microbacterium invictum]WQB70506.1 dihydrofolate reductase family protein [Microbacterium invictum]
MTATDRPRVVVQEWVSLDGYASGPRNEMDIMSVVTEDADRRSQAYNAVFLAAVSAVLLGRQTYSSFARYWPTAEEPIAARVNALPKIVASRSLQSAPWGDHRPVTVVTDVEDHVRRFRHEGNGTLVVWGSLALTHSLVKAGLVDELDLFIAPVWLGNGTCLLPDGSVHLKQISSEDWGELTHLRYLVVGGSLDERHADLAPPTPEVS